MNEIVTFLSENKILFATLNTGVYTILVTNANESQTRQLIDLAEAQSLLYKIMNGVAIYESTPTAEAPKKAKKKA